YVLFLVLVLTSLFLKESFELLSRYIFGAALLLAYFSTLRLHFFSETPAVENVTIVSILLFIVSIGYLSVAYAKNSIYLLSIGALLFSVTALITNNAYSIGIALLFVATFAFFVHHKLGNSKFVNISILIVYLTHSIWLLGNPIFNHDHSFHELSFVNLLFILLYMLVFSLCNIERKTKGEETSFEITTATLNTFIPLVILLLSTLSKYNEFLSLTFSLSSLSLVIISMMLWIKHKSIYSTFLYAIGGYLAMSIAIVGFFPKPDFFVWLCWESLIVVSTAVWFKSKIIIVTNFVFYVLIYFSYLILAGSFGLISLTFGVVALLSARILNWQKARLELQTEMMRNAYLASALFIFPYALYHIVPNDFVGLSWMIVSLVYYLLSRYFQNKKYRWMSILTLLLTVVYMVLFGTTNLSPTYRILSFLFLGTALILVSISYSKRKRIQELTSKM
ncbi:MAG: hypothetical protein Q8L04_18750, partial [Ignavibacteria bacterium]|nr:hypothetical protein [Ignavibacteria bacterium]